MIVIVPHPDIELKLIKMQKEIIRQIIEADKEAVPYSAMPLWIETNFESLEQARKKITGITIMPAEYDEKKGCLACPVKIQTIDGIIESKLDFICGLLRCARNDELFPLDVKIFRLGECTSSKPGVYELSSTIWKKLSS